MIGKEVSLMQMMDCRDNRAAIQSALRKKYNTPCISFCMNIPGPVKTNSEIRRAFCQGKEALLQILAQHSFPVLEEIEIHEDTGDEWIAAVDASAPEIKHLTTVIEETAAVGRLYDMDVIGMDGLKLSRKDYRKCLVCGKQAQECARSRSHSISEMQAAVEKILELSPASFA